MTKRTVRHIPWLLFLAFAPGIARVRAVEPYQPVIADPMREPWRWRHIPELDGEGFRCMTEAPDGAMWFGVTGGALRYDGLNWEFHGAGEGLPLAAAERICSAADGSIYAASDNRLFRFRDGRWEPLLVMSGGWSPRPLCFCRSRAGGVWAGTTAGFYHASPRKAVFYTTSERLDPKTHLMLDPATELVYLPGHLEFGTTFIVQDVHEDAAGDLWLLVNAKFIVRHRAGRSFSDPDSWSKIPCDAGVRIMRAKGGELWVVRGYNRQEIQRYDVETGRWSSLNLEEAGGESFCEGVLETRDGTLWVYGRKYLQARREGEWGIYEHPDRSEDRIHMIETSDGALWTGKRLGRVYRVDRSSRRWLTYEGLHFQCGSPGEDGEGGGGANEWFLTAEGDAVRHGGDIWRRYGAEDGLMADPVAMTCTRGGQVWAVGSHRGAAATAWLEGDAWTLRVHRDLGWTVDYRSAIECPEGVMLFGANNESPEGRFGLIRAELGGRDGPRFDYFERGGSFRGACGMARGPDGLVWLAGRFLNAFDGERVRDLSGQGLLVPSWIDAIDADPSGRIWISMGGIGVSCYDGKQWQGYTTKDGLADMMAAAILCAPDGTVWAATPEGISRFDGRRWTPRVFGRDFPGFVRESGTFRAAGKDGLWINYAARDWYFRAKRGQAYDRASLPGFRTIRYRPERTRPETKITLSVDRVSQPGNTILAWSGISPWHATAPDALEYSWRLDQGPWSPFAAETSRTFLHLAPGRHTFEARARDQDFNVDPSPARIAFVVVAPLWRQPWFLLMVLSFLGVIAVLGFHLIRAHERHLVAQERGRAEVARMKLDLFTHLSHELRTPLTVIPLPIERAMAALQDDRLKRYLGIALKNVRGLQFLVEQILDMRRLQEGKLRIVPTEIELVQQTREVLESFQVLAEHQQVRLEFEPRTDPLRVRFDPQALMRVLGNLIGNAIKFTPAGGRVAVRLETSRGGASATGAGLSATFEVEDTGAGIPPEYLSHIFDPFYRGVAGRHRGIHGAGVGLALAHELVVRLGGTIEVASPVPGTSGGGPGTRFTVRLPLDEIGGHDE